MKLKKEIILVFFIIVFIITIEIVTNIYTENVVNEICEETEKIIDELYIRNVDNSIENLKIKWFEREKILSCYVEHNELDQVTNSLLSLEENAKNEEYEQALINGRDFLFWLEHFKNKNQLVLKNIL